MLGLFNRQNGTATARDAIRFNNKWKLLRWNTSACVLWRFVYGSFLSIILNIKQYLRGMVGVGKKVGIFFFFYVFKSFSTT